MVAVTPMGLIERVGAGALSLVAIVLPRIRRALAPVVLSPAVVRVSTPLLNEPPAPANPRCEANQRAASAGHGSGASKHAGATLRELLDGACLVRPDAVAVHAGAGGSVSSFASPTMTPRHAARGQHLVSRRRLRPTSKPRIGMLGWWRAGPFHALGGGPA